MHYDISIIRIKDSILNGTGVASFMETLKGLLESPDGLLEK